MNPLSANAFALPERLASKADPALIAADEAHFDAIARSLELTIEDLETRLAALQKSAARQGQAAMDHAARHQRKGRELETVARDRCQESGSRRFAQQPQGRAQGRL